jgi:ribokinase
MPTFDVITIGSALLDIYLKSDDFTKLSSKHFPDGNALALDFGGKTEVDDIEVCSGGAATNNAVSFARKGFKTAIVAEMGTDLIATTIKEELKRESVDVGMLVEEYSEETGISCILVHPNGGRSVAVFRGASKMLTVEDIPWHRLDTRWLYISSLGGDMTLMAELIHYAAGNDIKLAVNPGSAELKQPKIWEPLLPLIDVFFVNREEADMLGSKQLLAACPLICITDGKKGGEIIHNGSTLRYPAKIVSAVEETGAGDAFGSGFVAAIIKKHSLNTATKWGTGQAASVVSHMGAKRGLLTLNQIDK